MTDETFVLNCVRGGKPFLASEIPPLPGAALRTMLRRMREEPNLTPAELAMDMAYDVVAIALRRLDPAVNVHALYNEESQVMVDRIHVAIMKANPDIFPSVPKASVVESPNGAGPA